MAAVSSKDPAPDDGDRGSSALLGESNNGGTGDFEALAPVTDTEDETNDAEFDFDELYPDPAERAPGGQAAKSVQRQAATLGATRAWRRLWLRPLGVFLVALLLQSVGLYVATYRYVQWMEPRLGSNASALKHPSPTDPARFRLYDNFALQTQLAEVHDGVVQAKKSGMHDVWTTAVLLLWFALTLQSGNLRLWTRVMIIGATLATFKAIVSVATVLPDAGGYADCRHRLSELGHYQRPRGETRFVDWCTGLYLVLRLWVVGVVTGLRGYREQACAEQLPSGPTYLCVLFSLGIYDFAREKLTRTKPPRYRETFRILVALVLAMVTLGDALSDIEARRRYTMDVVVAIVLVMLLYASPWSAVLANRWVNQRARHADDLVDDGDVLVPICCIPLCFMHGRFFLSLLSADTVSEKLKDREERKNQEQDDLVEQAQIRAEDIWREEEEGIRNLMNMQALLQTDTYEERARAYSEELRSGAERRWSQAAVDYCRASESSLAMQKFSMRAEILAKLREERVRATELRMDSEQRKLDKARAKHGRRQHAVADVRAKLGSFGVVYSYFWTCKVDEDDFSFTDYGFESHPEADSEVTNDQMECIEECGFNVYVLVRKGQVRKVDLSAHQIASSNPAPSPTSMLNLPPES